MLSLALHLEIATPRCVADDFAGEIVALNLDTGFYFSLRGLAAAVWRDLAAHHSVGEIVSDIGARSPTLAAEALTLIEKVVASGLMRPRANGDVATTPVSAGSFVDEGAVSLVLETYDDLSDMVLTDPIHDVDEAVGWPVQRADA